MPILTYYMTPASPWTYLGHPRLTDMAARHRATVQLRPVDFGRVFPQSGGLPLAKRAPQRQAYRLVDLERSARHVGMPVNLHPKHFPVPPADAARLIIAADLAEGTDRAMALAFATMRAVWAEERDISDAATLAAIAAGCGFDAARLARHAEAASAAYERYTDEAIEAQVFGAPWYILDGEPFWGQDRLDFLARALEDATSR
jgi:2-hydroxychromene-2-carboxylate isomerase